MYNTVHCVGYCTLYYTLNCKVCIVVICCCSASSTSLLIPHSSYLKPHTPSYSLILHTSYLIPHTPSYFFILHTSYLIPRFFDSSYLIPHTSYLDSSILWLETPTFILLTYIKLIFLIHNL